MTIRSLIRVSLVLLATTGSADAQGSRAVCDLVSEADAASVIGAVKQKQSILGPDHCVFTSEGLSLMISRLADQEPEQIDGMMNLPRNRARQGDVVADEAGIGQRAVSERSGGSVTLFAVDGTTVWTLGLQHVYNKDLSDLLPKLRDLARKVLGASQSGGR